MEMKMGAADGEVVTPEQELDHLTRDTNNCAQKAKDLIRAINELVDASVNSDNPFRLDPDRAKDEAIQLTAIPLLKECIQTAIQRRIITGR